MKLRWIATLAMVLTACADSEPATTTTTPTTVSTTSTAAPTAPTDEQMDALHQRLETEGIEPNVAGSAVNWCTHQDLAMLAREIGGDIALAEQVSEAASETVC